MAGRFHVTQRHGVHNKISSGDFSRYVLIAVAIVGLVALGWQIIDVFLLAFGGIVFAAVLRALANILVMYLRTSERWSLVIVVILLLVLFGALTWLFGDQLVQQTEQLQTQLPQAYDAVQGQLQKWSGGKLAISTLQTAIHGSSVAGNFAKFAAVTAGFIGHAVVMLFVGLYLALDPDVYVRGVVRLFPPQRRPQMRDAFERSGEALRKWLVGQLAAMTIVGVLTGVGLGFAGVPLALALGVLAGLLDFIPVVGPIVSIVPGLLLAMSHSPRTAVYALIVYIAVQQLENHVIVPLAQRWSVKLPPAVALLSIVAMGLLFGLLGVLFAMPVTVVAMVLLKKLYIEGALEKKSSELDEPVVVRGR